MPKKSLPCAIFTLAFLFMSVSGWAEEPSASGPLEQLVCRGALQMSFPDGTKQPRDLYQDHLNLLLQTATGVASISVLPFGAYNFRKTFIFNREGDLLTFEANKDHDRYHQHSKITLDWATGILNVFEYYEFKPDHTRNAISAGIYQCGVTEMKRD